MHKIRTTIILLLIASSVLAQNALFPLKTTNKKKEETEKNVAQYDYFFFNALIAKSQENQLEALSFFQQCIDLNSKEPAPFYESALINKNLGNYDLSISQIKKAVELAPNNKWYLLAYANILFFSEEYKKSAIQYKKLISKNPDNQEMYFMLADAYIYDNNFQQAINVYDELEKILGVDKTLSLQKQKLYVQINKKKKAIKELEKLLEKTPEDVEVLQLVSELYFLNNQKDKAFQVLKKISTIQPDNGRIHLTLADYYRENGEKQKSYNELKQAFKSKKLDLETKIRILFSYLPLIKDNQEMRLQAHELVEILVEKHVDDYIVYMLYGDILYSENKLLEAKDKYLFSLELNKANIEAWTQVLFIQAEEKDFLQMIKTSNEALKYFPLEPVFYFFQGYSNKNFKNYDEAIQSFKTGIYNYYLDDDYDAIQANILERYKKYNGMEGNSPTTEMSDAENVDGYPTQATNTPDIEDINQDNNLSETESYFQYKVSLRPSDLQVGKNYITNVQIYEQGNKKEEWLQFKIPIREYQKKVKKI